MDAQQQVLEWDQGAAALTAKSAPEALGRRCFELLRGRDGSGRAVCGENCPCFRALKRGRLVGRASFVTARAGTTPIQLCCRVTALPRVPGGAIAVLQPPGSVRPTVAEDLAALATLTTSLSPAQLQDSLERALDVLREAAEADAAELFLAEPDGRGMALTCYRGTFRRAFCQIPRFDPGQGFPGRVLTERRPLVTASLHDDPRYLRTRVKRVGFRSYFCVPLWGPGGVQGAVAVAYRGPCSREGRALDLLSWASVPIGNAILAGLSHLWSSIDLPADETDLDGRAAPKLSLVLRKMVTLAGAEGGDLHLLEPHGDRFAHRVCHGTDLAPACPVLLGAAPATCPVYKDQRGAVLCRTLFPGASSCQRPYTRGGICYCLPMRADGEGVGLVRLWNRRLGSTIPTRSLVLLETAAAVAAREVRDGWRYREIQRRDAKAGAARETATVQVRPSAPAPHLEIRCLGDFELRRQGVLVTREMLHRRKALTLIKILLAHDGRRLPKEALVEWLWPEGPPGVRAQQLYVLVHESRRLVEPEGAGGKWVFIRNDGDRYYFNGRSSCYVDVREFLAALQTAREAEARGAAAAAVAAYEQAADLYTGDFMADEPFAEWCWQQREYLRENALDGLQRLAALLGKVGRWDRSVKFLRRALFIDQLREEVHRDLMFALWAAGRRDEAARQYKICAEVLKTELDVEPLPDTTALFQRIQQQPRP